MSNKGTYYITTPIIMKLLEDNIDALITLHSYQKATCQTAFIPKKKAEQETREILSQWRSLGEGEQPSL